MTGFPRNAFHQLSKHEASGVSVSSAVVAAELRVQKFAVAKISRGICRIDFASTLLDFLLKYLLESSQIVLVL